MRYAIFSDVHANRQAWDAVRADMERMNVDTLVCLGDVVGYGPMPLEVLTAVREATLNFVLGNHDAAACGRLDPSIFNERARIVIEWTRERLDEEALRFLGQVPLQMDSAAIQFCHAEMVEPGEFGYIDGPGPAGLNLQAMTKPIGFIGHTHLPMAFTMPRRGGQVMQLPPMDFEVERGKRYIVNVGSVGEPRTTDVRASYVIYDDTERKVVFRKVVFDVEAYKADLVASGLDISPYFVQVVDAGKMAGQPVPAAAPQMALAHLPKVAEVVAGHHGRLVTGIAGAGWSRAGSLAPVAPPKTLPGWMVAMLVMLVLVVIGAVAVVMTKKGDDLAAKGGDPPKVEGGEAVQPAGAVVIGAGARERSGDAAARRGVGVGVVLRDVKVRLFARDFEDLATLREAERNGEEVGEAPVADGLIGLDAARGQTAFGLVWDGQLVVPFTGEYEFTLEAGTALSLSIKGDTILQVDAQTAAESRTKKVWLAKDDEWPFRLEYIHRDGVPTIGVEWSRVRGSEKNSLVRTTPLKEAPVLAKRERAPAPEVPAEPGALVAHERPELLAHKLRSYWSFDSRESGTSQFEVLNDGSVVENLIKENQRIQYHVPGGDIGRSWLDPTRRIEQADWTVGVNGVGYDEQPGEYARFLRTVLDTKKGSYPFSVYVRIPFEVEDKAAYQPGSLVLILRCDDGYEVSLNNSVMGTSNLADPPIRWNSNAKESVTVADVLEPKKINLGGRGDRSLRNGTNILGIHGLNHGPNRGGQNAGSTSTDMLIHARLMVLRKDGSLPGETGSGRPNPQDLPVEPGELKGTVTAGEGKFGDAYDFQEGSIEIGKKEEHSVGEESFTLCLWFTRAPDSVDDKVRRLISAGAGSRTDKPGWALWISAKGDGLTFALSDGKQRVENITAKDESLASGEWRHAAVTVDRENGKAALFLDGQLVNETALPFAKDEKIESVSGLAIGRNSDGDDHHRGKIDEVAIWNRMLLPEEILEIYQSETGLGAVFSAQAK